PKLAANARAASPNSAAGVSKRALPLVLNLGRSARPCTRAYRPPASRIRMPLGLAPKSCRFLPSVCVTSVETSVQLPTSWSLSVFCCAIALPEVSAQERMVANVAILRIVFLLNIAEWAARDCYVHQCDFKNATERNARRQSRHSWLPLKKGTRRSFGSSVTQPWCKEPGSRLCGATAPIGISARATKIDK